MSFVLILPSTKYYVIHFADKYTIVKRFSEVNIKQTHNTHTNVGKNTGLLQYIV